MGERMSRLHHSVVVSDSLVDSGRGDTWGDGWNNGLDSTDYALNGSLLAQFRQSQARGNQFYQTMLMKKW